MNILRGTTEAERKTLNRRCRNGELHRVHPNTFMPTTEWSTLDATGRRRVTHLTAVDSREGMVVVGRSAALAWGLEIFDRRIADAELRSHAADPDPEVNNDIIELAHPTRRRYETRGLVHERKLGWGPEDLRRVDGRPVTSVGATVADITLRHGLDHGLVAADSALRAGHSAIELARSANRSTNPRRALQTVAYATQFADSAAESILRAQIIEAGLSAPEVQLRVFRADKVLIGYADLGFPGHLAMIEVHGKGKFLGAYGDPGERSYREWRRESELIAEGLAVLRVTWEEILSGEALRRIRELLVAQRAKIAAGARTTARFVGAGERWPDGYRTRRVRGNDAA